MEMAMPIPSGMIEGIKELIERMAKPGTQDLMRVEQAVRYGFAGNFARQGAGDSPPWAPLAPRTQRERQRAGYNPNRPILVRSGLYRTSWLSLSPNGFRNMDYRADGWTMSVGSGDYRVDWLNSGVPGRNLPARPVHYLDTGQINNIAAAMEEMQNRVITALGL
jgi:hypothetical protein